MADRVVGPHSKPINTISFSWDVDFGGIAFDVNNGLFVTYLDDPQEEISSTFILPPSVEIEEEYDG